MADYTYEQLKDMQVAQLREIAAGLKKDELEGHMTMHKDHLLPLLCKVLNVPTHHVAAGEDKLRLKAAIKKLKVQRDAAIKDKNAAQLAVVRGHIHALKRKLRQLADEAPAAAPAGAAAPAAAEKK